MKIGLVHLASGTVTSPKGFYAGATYAGIKKRGDDTLDLALLYSKTPCAAAGVFTSNRIKAAPVVLSQARVKTGRARAVIINSGCANACTGETGMADAAAMAEAAATAIGILPEEVLVASTGVIGVRLPMALVTEGVKDIVLAAESGHELARAIMTTDTVSKEVAVTAGGFTIGGVAKGSGMIHPDMATMLSFLTTDAAVEPAFLQSALARAADLSFNMISVDGDTSTNDSLILLANGKAGGLLIFEGSPDAEAFQTALNEVCVILAKKVARDGEGATRLIEVNVKGARSETEARKAARTVISSSLVKTAVHGADPNWGRVLAAVGRSRIDVVERRVDLYLGEICLLRQGTPQPFDAEQAVRLLKQEVVAFTIDLNLGGGAATGWGCDLSERYVKINAEYTT